MRKIGRKDFIYFNEKKYLTLLLVCIFFASTNLFSQVAADGLNNSTTLFTLTNGAYFTGNSAAGDRPANSPFASEGTHSRGVSNNSATLLTGDINTSSFTGIALSFRLASFSIGSTGNGADAGDIVTVEVSPDGGANYYSTIRVLGNGNAFWAYTATGVATTVYDGNATPVDFAPAGGGSRTTDGFSTVSITGLPAVSNLRVRITLLNDNANERWVVDDFQITGTCAPAAATPAGSITPVANPACSGTTLSYSAGAADVYWQTTATGTNSSPANQTTNTFPVTTSGTYYVRRFNGTCWSTALASAPIVVNTPIAIVTQPTSTTVTSPANATFTVTTTGTVAGYQWQVNDGTGWVNATGAPYSGETTNTLTISPATTPLDGFAYRCIITAASPCTNLTTDVVTLTVNEGPCISDIAGYTGWTLTGASSSTAQSCTGNGILFTAAGQFAVTPAVTNPIALNFNKKRSSDGTAWALTIQVGTSATGPWTTVTTVTSITATCTANPSIDLSAYTGTRYIRFLDSRASGAQQRGIDDITITCGTGCVATHSITSFLPTSGPAGTLVTITGTGFAAGAIVKFGGIASTSVTVVNATTIVAEVPAGAVSGKIGVTQSSCEVTSSASFSVLNQNANCGTGATGTNGLIISEVFDSFAGSLSYIELFNPTSAGISLSTYTLRIQTDGSTNTDYSLGSTIIPSGGVFVIRIGDPLIGTDCGSVFNLNFDLGSGFNGNDRIILRRSGIDHDVVNNPNYGSSSSNATRGFSQLRNTGILTPSTSYNSSEWNNVTSESCDNLGTAPTSLSNSNVNITTQPADVNCGTVTFSVTATATPGTINYVWRYLAPGSDVWLNVSDLSTNLSGAVTTSAAGLPTITISGSTALLQDYQFYCQIGSGGSPQCLRYSNAVQYSTTTLPIYRTRQSGNWKDLSTWEYSNSILGPWTVPVCSYPQASNSTEVIILNTHKVILEANTTIDIDKLTIDFGGELEISNLNSELIVLNGQAGADLFVNGTLTDRGTSGNGLDFEDNTGTANDASWLMGVAATVIKTNSSSAANYRDFYQGGISTIPNGSGGARFIYRFNSDGAPSVVAAGMFYPNLYFESETGGTYSFSSVINSVLTGSANNCTVYGNMFIGTTGLGSVTVFNNNFNTNPMLINGNLSIGTGSTLTNTSYNGGSSGSHGIGTGFDVKGNVLVNGILTVNAGATTGLLILSGTNPQSISGTGSINLQNLTINNSSTGAGGGVTLNRALDMNGVLTLTNGLVNTTSTNILTLTGTATCPGTNPGGGSLASFINGPMRKIGTADFIFPVGKPVQPTTTILPPSIAINTGGYRPIGISGLSASETFQAEYQLSNPYLQGPISANATGAGLQAISRCEYWDLTRTGTATATVTLSWSDNSLGQSQCNIGSYISNTTAAVVVPYFGGQWGDQNPDYFGQSGSPTLPVSSSESIGTISWNGSTGIIDSYQKFVIGTISWQLAPLPFDLTVFNATGKNKQVQLDWTVNNNQQLKEYTVERSRDGQRFEFFKTVSARAQEQRASYTDLDPAPFAGWNYYRLKAVTHSGEVYYSETRKVNMGQQAEIRLSPNPARNILTIRLPNAGAVTELTISNSVGQVLRQMKPTADVLTVDLSAWPSGVYYVRMISATEVIVKPFVKE